MLWLLRITSLALLVLPLTAHSDAWNEIIRYTCDTTQQLVRVQYIGAYIEDGKHFMSSKGQDDWDPWALVTSDSRENGRYIKAVKTIRKACTLSDGIYKVEIRPKPCNSDTQGQSGAMMMAYASISRGSNYVGDASFGGCSVDGTVTTSIMLRAGRAASEIETKRAEDYFR